MFDLLNVEPPTLLMASNEYSVPTPEDRQTITCLFCGKPQEVGRRALSITCRFCNKSLKLEDLRFKEYQARRSVETCGIVTVEKKANVVLSDRVQCGGLIVRGKLKGDVISRGPVLVGPEAEIKGNVTAPALAVGAGAILDGHYHIGPEKPAKATKTVVKKTVPTAVPSSNIAAQNPAS